MTWKSKRTEGKSRIFLWLILVGYLSGIAHKIINSRDVVIWLYVLNAAMVLADILLMHRYGKSHSSPKELSRPASAPKKIICKSIVNKCGIIRVESANPVGDKRVGFGWDLKHRTRQGDCWRC
jgi:hypothetical protein